MEESEDIGVVINGILFKDEDCKEYRKRESFVFGQPMKPCPRTLKEKLIAEGYPVYKWPSEKHKISGIMTFPIAYL